MTQTDNTQTAAFDASTVSISRIFAEAKSVEEIARSFDNLLKSSGQLTPNMNGENVSFRIIGNGTYLEAREATDTAKATPAKVIYNTDLISSVAMQGPKFKGALEAFRSYLSHGDLDACKAAAQAMLNAIRVSASVWAASDPGFVSNQLCTGIVEHVTTERGSILRVSKPVAKKAINAAKPTFSFASLLSEDSEPVDAKAPVAGAAPSVFDEVGA